MKKECLKFLVIGCCIILLLVGCSFEKSNENEMTPESVETKEFTRGTWDNKRYQNEFFHLNIDFPENWEFLSDEELEERYGSVDDGKNAYLFFGIADNNSQNVTAVSEKVTSSVDVNSYEENLKKQFEDFEEYHYQVEKVEDVVIAGNTYRKMELSASIYDTLVKQCYYLRKEGDYMIALIITATSDEIVAEIEEYIQ